MPLSQLIVATGNAHKLKEISAILAGLATVSSASPMPEVVENAPNFAGNAILKALAINAECNHWILADDSGLEVDALDGRPGVHTARYAGENASDKANRSKLIRELERVGALEPSSRSARFRCALALVRDGQVIAQFESSCEGHIASQPVGSGGFGYDPLFIPLGHKQTFAELASDTKHALSHRGKALALLKSWLKEQNVS